MAAPRYGRIEGARFHLCENKLCFARFKKAWKMIKRFLLQMRKVKNSESQVARVEPLKWSLGNNWYAKNCNAGIKRLNLVYVPVASCRAILY